MRRYYGRAGSSKGILIILSILICVFFFSGCAKEKKPRHKRLPPVGRREPGDVMRPAPIPAAEGVQTPERMASMRLIDTGKSLLDEDDFELAATKFRDAINVDSSNGIAYYYLALSQYYMEHPEIAAGLLDKAESLLGYDEEWGRKIQELRLELGTPSPPAYSNPSNDEGF